jgi:hypothetical protein
MKQADVQIGHTYTAKVSDRIVPVFVVSASYSSTYQHRDRFVVVNLVTSRRLRMTAAKLRLHDPKLCGKCLKDAS